MARSPSSLRSALRKLLRASGPGTGSLNSMHGSLHGQRFDDKVPAWLLLNISPNFDTFSHGSHLRSERDEGEVYSSIRRTPSLSRVDLESNPRTAKSRNNMWVNESSGFMIPEQRWSYQSRTTSSSFVLHPLTAMSSRGFSSGINRDDTARIVTPTTPPDGSTEGAENLAYKVKDWVETAYHGMADSAKAVENVVDVVTPPIKRILETHPMFLEISIPVSIFTGAWVILPRVLRRMHSYVEMGSAALLQGQERLQTINGEVYESRIPYDLSVWKAMEDPARLFATLLTMLQVGVLVAPNAAVAQYLTQFWSGGSLLCVVWFLHNWKSNVFKRLLSGRQISKEDRERYMGFDKFSSLGLIFIGALGLAEAAGVAVSSLLTVGGIGGIATAFAAREILANFLTGLTLSFSKPFTVGDTIKAGAVEGKVEEVGMISTRLLNLEKNPIVVPNAFFTSQAITNKSRAPWRSLSVKIPIHLQDFEKVPSITLEIREMLYRNPQVYLDEDKPRCHIAQFSPAALEIAIGCNIKPMSKNEYLLVEQGILVEAARIITGFGATLGGA